MSPSWWNVWSQFPTWGVRVFVVVAIAIPSTWAHAGTPPSASQTRQLVPRCSGNLPEPLEPSLVPGHGNPFIQHETLISLTISPLLSAHLHSSGWFLTPVKGENRNER